RWRGRQPGLCPAGGAAGMALSRAEARDPGGKHADRDDPETAAAGRHPPRLGRSAAVTPLIPPPAGGLLVLLRHGVAAEDLATPFKLLLPVDHQVAAGPKPGELHELRNGVDLVIVAAVGESGDLASEVLQPGRILREEHLPGFQLASGGGPARRLVGDWRDSVQL